MNQTIENLYDCAPAFNDGEIAGNLREGGRLGRKEARAHGGRDKEAEGGRRGPLRRSKSGIDTSLIAIRGHEEGGEEILSISINNINDIGIRNRMPVHCHNVEPSGRNTLPYLGVIPRLCWTECNEIKFKITS